MPLLLILTIQLFILPVFSFSDQSELQDYSILLNCSLELEEDNTPEKLQQIQFVLQEEETGLYLIADAVPAGGGYRAVGWSQNEESATLLQPYSRGEGPADLRIHGLTSQSVALIQWRIPTGYSLMRDLVTIRIEQNEGKTVFRVCDSDPQPLTGNTVFLETVNMQGYDFPELYSKADMMQQSILNTIGGTLIIASLIGMILCYASYKQEKITKKES